jgi:hypothetical protein
MDFYLVSRKVVLAEEFVRRDDFSTAGLRSSDAGLSRLVRTDPGLDTVAIAGAAGAPPLRDYEEFASAPMLSLTPNEPLPGFREKRFYRILFARTPVGEPALGGDLAEAGDGYSWSLRLIAGGAAWCLDLSAHLNTGATLGPVLGRLTDEMRLRHGLIPVTTERFQ